MSSGRPPDRNRLGLTPAQHAVLRLSVTGMSERQIARRLRIRLSTVNNHLEAVRAALGSPKTAGLVHVIARRAGLGDMAAAADRAAGITA